jgi:hypothetical protein
VSAQILGTPTGGKGLWESHRAGDGGSLQIPWGMPPVCVFRGLQAAGNPQFQPNSRQQFCHHLELSNSGRRIMEGGSMMSRARKPATHG